MTITQRIVDIDVSSEMQQSFLEYSYSVIYSRALPDVRDGLKPVQRRIVYQMWEMGLTPDKGHVKCARVVGEVMGKLHPHGDQAIYDALVRLAQPFNMRITLVDGHGNFGSPDDGPAAARYTEARMAKAAVEMTADLGEEVVDFVPNYDSQLTEPDVLPSAYPNLLVNGASGIAVGMATNMAPHNLAEVTKAAIALIKNPELSLKQLMKYVPGPDLPGGGIITSTEGIEEAYATGRGSFKVRSKVAIETTSKRRLGLVVTELPYQVGTERVIEKIKDAVNSKKLTGIADVQDLTDRKNGLRLVIEIKSGFDANEVLAELFRLTPLEDSFSINNIALVDGRPQTLGLKDLLMHYIEHRLDVVKRRSRYRLDKRQARLHLVQGLEIAVLNIDEVIEVIRTSDTVDDARSRLMSVFDLSQLQAEHILELRLRRLTRFSMIELETERDKLLAEIAQLQLILGDPELLRQTIAEELAETSNRLATPRRTAIGSLESGSQETEVVLSPTQKLVRLPKMETDTAGSKLAGTRLPADQDIAVFTSDGVAHRVHANDIPPLLDASQLQSAPSVEQFLGLEKGIRFIGALPWSETETIALATKLGVIKRLNSGLPDKISLSVISLSQTDEVISVASGEGQFVLISSDAQLLKFDTSQVRPQGFSAGGMTGMKLSDGAKLISMCISSDDHLVVTAANSSASLVGTDPGTAKATPLAEYPSKGRGTMGVRCHKFNKNEDQLYFAAAGLDKSLFTEDGKKLELPEISKRDGSGQRQAATIASLA